MQYDWIDFYTEFATKLLPFKADRKALIQQIYAVYNMAGMSVPKLESGDEVIDIDPFTIFGTFNKGITNTNRIAILNGIASVFGISATVPSNFDGIPVLNNLKATFYGFKDDRKSGDIDNLWSLFEAALALADNDTEDNRQKFSEAYDKVHDQLCIRWNITMALYWIRPYIFINLDSRNRWFISDVQNMPGEFVVAAEKKLKKVPYAADYLEIKELCKKVLDVGQYEYKSFPDLSYAAWIVSEKVNQEKSVEKGKKTSKAEFLKWFMPLLQALRDLGGSATPVEARKKIIENEHLSDEVINETRGKTKVNKFENEVAFARNYLVGAGYIDKSVSLAMLDYALRRRFAFFDIKPGFETPGFREYRMALDNEKFNKLISCVESLNREISVDESLGEGFCIGHSYFCNLQPETIDDSWLYGVVEYELIPLLKEYWFDEPMKVKDWSENLRSTIK